MECELFWTLYNDMFACGIPSDHVMVFWSLEQAVERRVSRGGGGRGGGKTDAYSLVKKVACGLDSDFWGGGCCCSWTLRVEPVSSVGESLLEEEWALAEGCWGYKGAFVLMCG